MKKDTILTIKGITHGSLVPLLIMFLINYIFRGNYGLLVATFYILVLATLYKNSEKTVVRRAFYYTISAILIFLLIFVLIVALSVF